MPTAPLISATALQQLLAASPHTSVTKPVVVDCSFDLVKPEAGRQSHREGHIPGAVYLHLEEDLSGAKNGRNGRHPLPSREVFAARMAQLGVTSGAFVVAYDNAGGMYAARLWWMLRWIGHAEVAVLDGGLAAWRAAGLPLESQSAPSVSRASDLGVRPALVPSVNRELLLTNLNLTGQPGHLLVVDARSPDRFRGENETLDPVGGRIPGAVNRFFKDNLGPDGRFKAASQLRKEWLEVTGNRTPSSLVMQCGSGVTACHNLLAMEVAGLSGAALYPGSWSEWCADPSAPVERGAA